jgi:signal transduction histidine kinase
MLQKSLPAETAEAPAQRMEIVGRLAGGIVHDFNNVLTVITGTIGILAEAVADRPDLAAIARLIDEAATRGADLTAHLLAFIHSQPSQPCDVDVNALLVDAARLLRPMLGEQIEIEIDTVPASDVASALVDPRRLMTAILNLAIMARDAMPEGGKLTFETGHAKTGHAETGNTMADEGRFGAHVEVCVGDEVVVAVNACRVGVSADRPDRADLDIDINMVLDIDINMVLDIVRPTYGRVKMDHEAGHGTSVKIYLPPAKGFVQPLAEASNSRG